ncbi:MAG TPA: DNA polymerase I [Desulfotomaculum sp.]|nr:MAG: DNA polymerase I [Desulfotomaculum sp. BICA1-6]HBX24589.1 DNA polymerase I [Desulfotomaculum sp.]
MSHNRFLIIDGNSLIHRAFHALPPLSTSDGTVTNAVYGFTTMLLKVLQLVEPDYIAVAFDKGRTTFRHESYAEYKAKRTATPPELKPQFPVVKEVLNCMRIPFLELDNYEADDIIGTLTCIAASSNLESVILTGDRDALQLVSPRVKVMLTQKGITETEEYDEGRVWDRYGVTPSQLIDIKGLMGDTSDNIPGVPGIGEKTAMKLIQEYGSLEKVVENAAGLPPRWRNKIVEYKDQALLSKQLGTIDCQTPLEFDHQTLHWPGPNYQALLEIFSRLEFKTLVRSIIDKVGNQEGLPGTPKQPSGDNAGTDTYRVHYDTPATEQALHDLREMAGAADKVALLLEGNRERGINRAVLVPENGTVYLLPVREQPAALDLVGDLCACSRPGKLCFNGKQAIWLLHRHNRRLEGLSFDAALAAYLLNPGTSQTAPSTLAAQYMNLILPVEDEPALAAGAEILSRLTGILDTKLTELGMDRLYYDVELPLVSILAEMEIDGVAINPDVLRDMGEETGRQIDQLVLEIYRLAGEKFNINSTKQLGHILFEKLNLPVIKRTKTGYSTDASVLEELAASHEIVSQILEYRQLAKLKSTYIDGLAALINPFTGRIHTTFHQNVTTTGRLSSSEPNLQNIPIRLEQGRKIRRCFIPRREGNVILAADYSQVELRILAHMSGDTNLVDAFIKSQDIHTRTASEVFGVPMEQVTAELRSRAKAVNFGIVYGISDFGLARDIRVSRAEAGDYIRSYFARYSGVKDFISRKIAEAKDQGYATTMLNRRRYLPDLFSSNRMTRAFGERTAVNTPIQGSAADIIKLAMVRINEELKNRGMETKMILQVHDELIFDVPAGELEQAKQMVREYMQNVLQLDVPLVVDLKTGPNWYDVRKV